MVAQTQGCEKNIRKCTPIDANSMLWFLLAIAILLVITAKIVTTDTRSVIDFFASSAPSRLCVGFYWLNDSGISVLIALVNPQLVKQLLVMVFIRVISGQQFFTVKNRVGASEETQRLFFIAHFGAAG